jgi:hypothetical protein
MQVVTGSRPKRLTFDSIQSACCNLGLKGKEVLDVVKEFGLCNGFPKNLIQTNLLTLIEKRKFETLAERLWRDHAIYRWYSLRIMEDVFLSVF